MTSLSPRRNFFINNGGDAQHSHLLRLSNHAWNKNLAILSLMLQLCFRLLGEIISIHFCFAEDLSSPVWILKGSPALRTLWGAIKILWAFFEWNFLRLEWKVFPDWIFSDKAAIAWHRRRQSVFVNVENSMMERSLPRRGFFRKVIRFIMPSIRSRAINLRHSKEYGKYLVTLIKYEIYHCTLITVTAKYFFHYAHSIRTRIDLHHLTDEEEKIRGPRAT